MKAFNVVGNYVYDENRIVVRYVNDEVTYKTLERLYAGITIVLFS